MKPSELADAIGHDLEFETVEPEVAPASRPAQRPHQRDDDAGAGLPHGWLDCPAYGLGRFDQFIPCKVILLQYVRSYSLRVTDVSLSPFCDIRVL